MKVIQYLSGKTDDRYQFNLETIFTFILAELQAEARFEETDFGMLLIICKKDNKGGEVELSRTEIGHVSKRRVIEQFLIDQIKTALIK